jgi:acyl-CoA thioester hydrolase
MKLDFKTPLRCDDRFVSRLALEKEGVKYIFNQDIVRLSDEHLACRVEVVIVAVVNGKLVAECPELDCLLQ